MSIMTTCIVDQVLFQNSYQAGLFSIFYAIGSKPLYLWNSGVRNGHIKRITDEELLSAAVEIGGTNVSTTYVSCPADPQQTLGIKLPFFSMLVKNVAKYFTFEVEVLDDKNQRRRFRAASFNASGAKVQPFFCSMPLRLDRGWNSLTLNLAEFTKQAYGTNYMETLRVTIHANCRLRRVFFSDRLYSPEELPPEFRLVIRSQQRLPLMQSSSAPSLRQVPEQEHQDQDDEQQMMESVASSSSFSLAKKNCSVASPISTAASESDFHVGGRRDW
eukprot:TRINITY_DN13721_c0_g1_i3.p1 TRINITY_DN13721_c0_g1~~TRINITY_DN13721_c0_g1_i3.p1  ORF type:complete len:273 (-),score=49.44 TRINITY_DN13721_c0_g1_i3:180-998(-)